MVVAITKQPVATVDPVLSKAALRAADQLGVAQGELAAVIGVSPSIVSRAGRGGPLLANAKARELATLFVRMFRSLDAIVGGDPVVAARWLREPNLALGTIPIEAMKTVAGLVATLSYLDARRALV